MGPGGLTVSGIRLAAISLAFALPLSAVEVKTNGSHIELSNRSMARVLDTAQGRLTTARVVNKRAGTNAVPSQCAEFRLRISRGTDKTGTDQWLTAADFEVKEVKPYTPAGKADHRGIAVSLFNDKHGLSVTACYELGPNAFYMRKFLKITAQKAVTLERIDVEAVTLADAEQPYRIKCIYARGKWSPGLGQPLYTTKSGTFWGIEFPAAYNTVEAQQLACGYLWGRTLEPGQTYTTYKAVTGVSDDPAFNQDTFFEYINRVRVRPLRLQVQYNSWFDFGGGVRKETFASTVRTLHKELVEERACKPLKAYVIDDGWQDTGKGVTWTDKTWKVNAKFDRDFAASFQATRDAQSHLGLWMSPGCNFGARRMVARYREAGFEALDNTMSLAGPKYMNLLESRMVELCKSGVTYFKLDGLFGHLNTRDFELHGERYGLPGMPQLALEGLGTSDQALNDPKYDELKTYYLVAGTERLMRIFTAMARANPDVYIVISNGAYLSPWWLMHVDSTWMIMAGDAARGADRTGELVYRDGVYHEIVKEERTQFPICALFNHEPKKTSTGESKETFRNYLYMNMSRGTGFIELYLKTKTLQAHDWDVLAEGIQWAHEIFPTFTRSRMHGGDPRKNEVYGYTGWSEDQGYVSIHNPSNEARHYSFTLDRAFGLVPASGRFHVSSPIAASLKGLNAQYGYGDTITLDLAPREIRALNFDKTPRDWSRLRALQTRSPYTPPPSPPLPKPISKDHPMLGVWQYKHANIDYRREFRLDGQCILWRGTEVNWKKSFKIVSQNRADIGSYTHIIQPDGSLLIEGRYRAKKLH